MSILGLAISHDASAALTTGNGVTIAALAEERISRKKSYTGLPLRAIEKLLKLNEEVNEVCIGTHKNLTIDDAIIFAAQLEGNPSNLDGVWGKEFPGFRGALKLNTNPQDLIQKLLQQRFAGLMDSKFIWINHHDSHLGCSLAASRCGQEDSLLVSLDGQGDGESGAIATLKGGALEVLSRISALDSLGELYSAVTRRYGFRPTEHEGKILGLAAYGHYSEAVKVLSRFVSVKDGQIKVHQVRNLKARLVGKSLRALGIPSKIALSLGEIVDLAESQTSSYPDLAYAIQQILESSVLEIINQFIDKTEINALGLAGGVFANVKLNQKISELKGVKTVNVFPNMGDGGISLGGIWSMLHGRGQLAQSNLFQDMYLAPETIEEDEFLMRQISSDSSLVVKEYNDELELIEFVAQKLHEGSVVALHRGRMEFGPRALCNRSLLADPGNADINRVLNEKLGRTEFMPFAPIVPIEFFEEYFQKESTQELTPFSFMTITCRVRDEKKSIIPAVVHVDGTARPQVVSKDSNPFAHAVITEFAKLSGYPVLINTSLNIHGQPINYCLKDSLGPLATEAYDILAFENRTVTLNKR